MATKDLEVLNASQDSQKVPKLGVRHTMAALLFTLLICMFLTRSTLSLAIVAMTDSTASINPDIPTYDWTYTSIILGAHYYSYIILQPFAGVIFLRLGMKWVVLITMLINCAAFMLIPVVVFRYGPNGLLVCRLVQGLVQGFFFPCVYASYGAWVPKNERSLLTMFINAGETTGFFISMFVTGYICASWWGWPAVFYILGSAGIIWSIFWAVFAADSPATHSKISEAEKKYIEQSLEAHEKFDSRTIPFKAILTSVPFWAMVLANLAYSFCYTINEISIPTYLANALDFDIASNGVASAGPKLVFLLICIPCGPLGDYLVSRKYISLWTWRRVSQVLGTVIPALALVWLAYISKEQRTLALVLLNISMGVTAMFVFGSLINHVDLSPRYAGVLLSIENPLSVAGALVAPIAIQFVVTDFASLVQWRSVFLPLAGSLIAFGLVFIFFGSSDIQWWNSKKSRLDDDKQEKEEYSISL